MCYQTGLRTVSQPRRIVALGARACFVLRVGLGLGLGLALGITPAQGREPCNRQRTSERPQQGGTGGSGGAVRYVCRHDLENNDDQVNEFYTYRASNLDGKRWQHQDQLRKRSLILKYYYGEMDLQGGWQWQEVQRYDDRDYSREGVIKTRQFAQRHPNGAWQQEYQWRNSTTGDLNSCYAQSALDPNGGQRQPLYQCTVNQRQTSGDAAPVPLRNPAFRRHQDY
jgi:hypothetical protein